MDNHTDAEYPYDEYLEPILKEQRERLAELSAEDDEEMHFEQPFGVMVARLKEKEGLTIKQASDYVYYFCIRKAPDVERPIGPMLEFEPTDITRKRKPWWCFWRR